MKKLLMTLVVLVTSSVLFACGEKAEFKRIKKYSRCNIQRSSRRRNRHEVSGGLLPTYCK